MLLELAILVSYLLVQSCWSNALALSIPKRSVVLNSSSLSVPIVPVYNDTNVAGIHPSIIQQQHANRGIARLARMKGLQAPSDEILLSNIYQRVLRLPPQAQLRHNITKIKELLGEITRNARRATHKTRDAHDSEPAHSIGLDAEPHDVGYVGTVQMGTPPRKIRLLMDSGSADLWVGAEGCQGDNGGGCGNHNFIGSNSSSSFNDTGKTWQISYRTGTVSGHIVEDNIMFADLAFQAFKFGVALTESSDFTGDDIPFDGLAGFAKSVISQQGTTTLVETLQNAGLIKEAITSYKIPRSADGKNDGEITLGALDTSKYVQDTLTTVKNVNRIGFWEVPIGGMTVGGKDMGWLNRTAILDTGTALIVAPAAEIEAIHNNIPGAKSDGMGWTVPCLTNTSISVTIGNQEFLFDPRDIAFQPVDENDPTGDCTSGFTEGNVSIFGLDNEWLFGDVFLKNAYFSTNVNTDEISLAKLA